MMFGIHLDGLFSSWLARHTFTGQLQTDWIAAELLVKENVKHFFAICFRPCVQHSSLD
jgi:hypothetical protein